MKWYEVPANKNSLAQRKLIQGKGINDATYNIEIIIDRKRISCPYYKVWVRMLARCYNEKFHKKYPTYKNCNVSEEWLLFSNFRKWMETQDWKDKHLDKDIILPGNKIYSPGTCVFITQSINNLFLGGTDNTRTYVKGVSFDKVNNKYRVNCCLGNGVAKNLGRFDTLEEASKTYNNFKRNIIIVIANQQTNPKIKNGLFLHAENYL